MKIPAKILLGLLLSGLITTTAIADALDEDKLAKISQLFAKQAVVGAIKIVDCTLSRGTRTTCFAISVTGKPVDHDAGPWCPTNIKDGKDKGGIWLDHGIAHDVDGHFIENLDQFFDDPQWSMVDKDTGQINVTNSRQSCAAAARPDVDPRFHNYCVQCQLDDMEHSTQRTYILPLHPFDTWWARGIDQHLGIGVALNGVRIDGSAPVDAILDAHTLAPFDDCGGHVNLHAGYHYHAMTGCSHQASVSNHAPLIGFAMDGYPIYAHTAPNGSEPDDLDRCGGHKTHELGYHYHAAQIGKNAIISCYAGETGCLNEGDDMTCDATKPRPRPARP